MLRNEKLQSIRLRTKTLKPIAIIKFSSEFLEMKRKGGKSERNEFFFSY